MRHGRGKRKLHRVKRQRNALLKSLARSLILQEGITTTVAKAKELRPFVERLVSAGKDGSLAARRLVASRLSPADANKLVVIAQRYKERSGGYTRIVLLGRIGKRAIESARIEFVK